MDNSTAGRYRGDFVAWPGVCGFIGAGRGQSPASHAHYAIQLVIGAPAGLRVQFGRHGEWQSCAGAIVPSKATHSIDVNACEWSAVLFVEPETPHGKALAARLQGRLQLLGPDVVAQAARRLDQAWRVLESRDAVRAACTQFIEDLSGAVHRDPTDARVLAAIEYIRQRIDRSVSLPEVASAAHLSPERFRHLFVQETGMPLRTYLLWRRLLLVYSLLMDGETLSVAAHAAGFADAAHLSRTARTMFGLPPSLLRMTGPLSARARTHHSA